MKLIMPTHIANALHVASRFALGGAPGGSGNIGEMVTGPLNSAVPGRTDNLPISVPTGSYVLPADVVSAVGEGNTAAGTSKLAKLFAEQPYAAQNGPYLTNPSIAPWGTSMPQRARGGVAPKVDIMAAGGEYVVPPDVVARMGDGNIKQGHAILDAFVKHVRDKNVKFLRKMPGPVKS